MEVGLTKTAFYSRLDKFGQGQDGSGRLKDGLHERDALLGDGDELVFCLLDGLSVGCDPVCFACILGRFKRLLPAVEVKTCLSNALSGSVRCQDSRTLVSCCRAYKQGTREEQERLT